MTMTSSLTVTVCAVVVLQCAFFGQLQKTRDDAQLDKLDDENGEMYSPYPKKCVCVPYYLCKNTTVVMRKEGYIDSRIPETHCVEPEVCCQSDPIYPSSSVGSNLSDSKPKPSGLESNPSGLASNLSGLESNPSGFASNLGGFESNLSGLASNLSGLESNPSGLASNLSSLESNPSGLESNPSGLESNPSGLESNPSDLASNLSGLESNPSGLASNLSGLESNPSGLASNLGGLESNPSGLASNLGGLESNPSGLASNLSGLESNPSDLASNLSGLESNPSGLASNLSGLESNPSGLASNLSGLESNPSGLASNLDGLESNPSGLATNLSGLESNPSGFESNPSSVEPKPSDIESKPNGCGYRNPGGIEFHATNQDESQFGEFPWMVAVLREESIDGQAQGLNVYQCGGALIHPQAVITAAHCVVDKAKQNSLKIRAGEWDTQTTAEIYPHQDRNVSKVIVHENFYSGGLFNDIAVLILDQPVEIAENVNVVCLPPQGTVTRSGTRCFASGWGKNAFGQEGLYQVILKKIELPIVGRDVCQAELRNSRMGPLFELHNSFICAGGEGKDTCKGDGGSPLACPVENQTNRYYQAGIVAWGIGCAEDNIPGVYVDVAKYINWINEQMIYNQLDMKSHSYL